MDIVRNATGRGHAGSPDASVEAELASLVDVYGLAILQVPEQIKLRLTQACPGAQRQIDAVLSALAADVPQRLRKAHDDEKLHGLLQQLVERVEDHGSLDGATASWAVRAWAHALALPTTSLAPSTSPDDPAAAREFAAVVTPLSRKPAPAAVSSTPPTAAPVAADASATVDEQARPFIEGDAIGSRAARPKVETVEPIVDSTAAEGVVVEPAVVEPAALEPAVVEPAVVEPVVVAPPIVVPAAAPAWTAHSAAAEGAPASGPAAGAVVTDTPMPPEPPRQPTGRRTLAIGAALVVIVLAIFFGGDRMHWFSGAKTSVQPAIQPPVQPPAPRDTSIADAASRATQAAPANPARETSSSSLPAVLSPAPASPTNGQETSEPPAAALKPEPPAAATVEPEPRAPASASSSNVASETQRPIIARVDVPRVIVGAPFTVAIRIGAGAHDIVAVERRVVEGSAVRPRVGAVTSSTGLRRSKGGAYLVPFKAVDSPSYATIEFTAVDRNGLRSVPKRVTLAVAAAPAVATVNCTRTTCGTVVAIRELDGGPAGRSSDRGARLYEVIIRMDDRTIHKATVPEYWSAGTWVQMVGGRFVSMKAGPR